MRITRPEKSLSASYAWLSITFYAFTVGTAACFVALFFFVERAGSARVLEWAWTCIAVSAACMLVMTLISAAESHSGQHDGAGSPLLR